MGIWPVGKGSRLNRILTIRWSGQLTDGLFQSALASILRSPGLYDPGFKKENLPRLEKRFTYVIDGMVTRLNA